MFKYLRDLWEPLSFLFRKGPEINPGAFTFIMKYTGLATLSLIVSVLGFIFDWELSTIIVLQAVSIVINIFIGHHLLKILRRPEQNKRLR